MLEQLFSSRARVKLLRLFLNNPGQPYYMRELARLLKIHLNSVRREVENLEQIGLVISAQASAGDQPKATAVGSKKFFLVNTDCVLYPELRALFLKAHVMLERTFVTRISQMARVKLLILTGIFVGDHQPLTDMLLVGTVNRKKFAQLVRNFQRDLNHEINYTVMSQSEYTYRHDITDRFLYGILEGKKIVVIDKLHDSSRL